MINHGSLLRGLIISLILTCSLLQGPMSSVSQPVPPAVTDPSPPTLKSLPRHVPPKEPKAIPREVVIKYKNSFLPPKTKIGQRDRVLKDLAKTLSGKFNAKTIATYPEFGWVRLKLPPELSRKAVIKTLMQDNNIEYARPNYEITLHGHTTPPPTSDYLWTHHFDPFYPSPYPSYSYLWGLDKIGMKQGWSLPNAQGGGVIIAVLDTGIDRDHPDISANYFSGKSYCGSSAMDSEGHGTHVAGIIGAKGDNGVNLNDKSFFVGVNKTAQLMAVKIDCGGGPNITDAIAGVRYAVTHGAAIINGSWGFEPFDKNDPEVLELKSEIEAGKKTTLYVASAGNDDRDFNICSTPNMWPQMFDLENLIVVAATNPSDSLWQRVRRSMSDACRPVDCPTFCPDSSNYGDSIVHLAAPGENIWSIQPLSLTGSGSNPISDFVLVGGSTGSTSSAAPFVSGCAALLQSRKTAMTAAPFLPHELKSILMTTGFHNNALNQKVVGGKRLNCFEALQSVSSDLTSPSNPTNLNVR